jgi:hypothetical protein
VGLVAVVAASAAASYFAVGAARDLFGGPGEPSDSPRGAVVHEKAPAAPAAPQASPEAGSAAPVEAMKSRLSAPAVPKAAAETAPAPAGEKTSVSEEALPAGMAIGADKGVLKVVTSGAHAIYVDGEFAGRGPVRIIPLKPGKHQVRTRLEGDEKQYSAEVQAGRLTRFAVGVE